MSVGGDPQKLEAGQIKWYSISRQFGFITKDDGTDVFVHHSAIVYLGNGDCDHAQRICFRALGLLQADAQARAGMNPSAIETALRGQRVKFWIAQGNGGPEARGVKSAS